jgi:hypothetical protein
VQMANSSERVPPLQAIGHMYPYAVHKRWSSLYNSQKRVLGTTYTVAMVWRMLYCMWSASLIYILFHVFLYLRHDKSMYIWPVELFCAFVPWAQFDSVCCVGCNWPFTTTCPHMQAVQRLGVVRTLNGCVRNGYSVDGICDESSKAVLFFFHVV